MRFLVACLLLLSVMPAWAAAADVPEAIQGRWADKNQGCDALGASLVISATTLVYPDGRIDDVVFTPDDGVLRIDQEATSYEYVAEDNLLLFRPEGFGMGRALPMIRCAEPVATERRCGWLANLTPGNWWLVDGERTWMLSEQRDDNVATTVVMDRVPDFDPEQFVSTGSYYGYGCACLMAATDDALGRITAVASSERLPLATCKADLSLPALSDW